jgi:Lauroyl/myristoyl acyltransferase
MKNFIFYIEYLALKTLAICLGILPWKMALKIGEGCGVFLTWALAKRFKRSVYDIQKAFPAKSKKEVKEIAKESWRNIGRILAETAQISLMSKEKMLEKIEFVNFDNLIKVNHSGKPTILHMGHFVNWELFAVAGSTLFKNMLSVGKPQTNPYVNKAINNLRTRYGSRVTSSYNPFFTCMKALKQGAMLGIVSDQSVISSPLYMNFLNRPAEVAPMTAFLSLKLNVPVYPIRMYRKNGKVYAEAYDPVLPPQEKFSHELLIKYTEQLKNIYEDWIRKDPASWLWAHNRWKREKKCLQKMKEAGYVK